MELVDQHVCDFRIIPNEDRHGIVHETAIATIDQSAIARIDAPALVGEGVLRDEDMAGLDIAACTAQLAVAGCRVHARIHRQQVAEYQDIAIRCAAAGIEWREEDQLLVETVDAVEGENDILQFSDRVLVPVTVDVEGGDQGAGPCHKVEIGEPDADFAG